MKSRLIKVLSLVLAVILGMSVFATAFAADEVQEGNPNEEVTESAVTLVDAKIVSVPLKNRVVLGHIPESPEGIGVELKYSDGTVVTDEIEAVDNKYYVNGERVERGASVDVVRYGKQKDVYYMNKGAIKIEYEYFAIPTISYVFDSLVSYIHVMFYYLTR